MASMAFFKFYPDDYDAATAHLTLEEDGAYMRLLRLCWRSPGCSIPNDPKWIQRKMRVSAEDYERIVAPIIAEFFHSSGARIASNRLSSEWQAASKTSVKHSEAGRKGGLATQRKNKEKVSSQAKATLKQQVQATLKHTRYQKPEEEDYTSSSGFKEGDDIANGTPTLADLEAKATSLAEQIKSGKSYLCTNISAVEARNLIAKGMVSEADCQKVGVL